MQLIVKSKHKAGKKPSELVGITRDGWVLGMDGAYGDLGDDCVIELSMFNHLKDFRKKENLSQQEMAWMLGMKRPTYIHLEQGKREIKLREFLILYAYIPDTEWTKMRSKTNLASK